MTVSDTSPVSVLKAHLDKTFGAVPWWNYETETLVLESGIPTSELLVEKVELLRVIMHRPELFYQNFMFFLHAVEVFNHHVTDFEFVPNPTSLEMAFAIVDMSRIFNHTPDESPPFSLEVRMCIERCLIEEGYSVPVFPFSIVGITGLHEGQLPKDTLNKEKAIAQYVQHSYN